MTIRCWTTSVERATGVIYKTSTYITHPSNTHFTLLHCFCIFCHQKHIIYVVYTMPKVPILSHCGPATSRRAFVRGLSSLDRGYTAPPARSLLLHRLENTMLNPQGRQTLVSVVQPNSCHPNFWSIRGKCAMFRELPQPTSTAGPNRKSKHRSSTTMHTIRFMPWKEPDLHWEAGKCDDHQPSILA